VDKSVKLRVETLLGKSSIYQEDFFPRKLELYVKYYVWSTALYGVEIWALRKKRSEITWKFWNVLLEKHGEDQLNQSCEK
jgi:hypothetical protein